MRLMHRRGRPMMALAVLLTSWVAARILVWEEPIPVPSPAGVRAAIVAPQTLDRSIAAPRMIAIAAQTSDLDAARSQYGWSPLQAAQPLPFMDAPAPAPVFVATRRHEMAPFVGSPAPSPLPYVSGEANPRSRRWSADGWMMLRDGGVSSPVTGPARASYGASQVGAVLRYRLAPDSGHRPAAYLRASAALRRPHDKEAAAGLSARPIAGLPVTIAAELRVGDISSEVRVRPAVMAVTELLPQTLFRGLRAEAYAQAGYVGGEGATAFADGQLRIDESVARTGSAELRAGGGVWGGAQEGASRLDIGPAATLTAPVSDVAFARLTLDWRFRIAGNAVPESGPALTLSAGF